MDTAKVYGLSQVFLWCLLGRALLIFLPTVLIQAFAIDKLDNKNI